MKTIYTQFPLTKRNFLSSVKIHKNRGKTNETVQKVRPPRQPQQQRHAAGYQNGDSRGDNPCERGSCAHRTQRRLPSLRSPRRRRRRRTTLSWITKPETIPRGTGTRQPSWALLQHRPHHGRSHLVGTSPQRCRNRSNERNELRRPQRRVTAPRTAQPTTRSAGLPPSSIRQTQKIPIHWEFFVIQ